MKVAWTGQVMAGVIVASGRTTPARASLVMCGVCGPSCLGVSATTRMTIVGCI